MVIRSIVKGFAHICFHTIYRTKIKGIENIPKEGKAVLCSNHIHMFDSAGIIAHVKRMTYIIAKEELFKTKFKNWFMRQMGTFPVARGTGGKEAIDTATEYLNQGNLLLIFPEGTRNGLAKGVKFQKGAAYIAIQSKSPVIPIGVTGTFKPFSKICINIGQPIDITEYLDDEKVDPRKVVALTKKIEGEVIKLRDEN